MSGRPDKSRLAEASVTLKTSGSSAALRAAGVVVEIVRQPSLPLNTLQGEICDS